MKTVEVSNWKIHKMLGFTKKVIDLRSDFCTMARFSYQTQLKNGWSSVYEDLKTLGYTKENDYEKIWWNGQNLTNKKIWKTGDSHFMRIMKSLGYTKESDNKDK